MKKIAIILVLLISSVLCVQAESLKLGNKTINYNIPDGYVIAMDGPYVPILNFMKQAMPADVTVYAMYVAQEADAKFRADREGALVENYLIVTSSKQLQNSTLTAKDFKEFRDYFNANHGSLSSSDLIDEINQTMNNLSGGAIQIGGIKSLGCFGESETAISFMALITQALDTEDRQIVVEQVMVSSSILVDGKMVTINQYKLVEQPDDVINFKDYSQTVIKNMGFETKTDAAGQSASSGSQATQSASSSGSGIIIIVIVVVIVLVVGGIAVLRKKRN